MKLFMPAVVVAVFSAFLTGIAVAQSPREQLQ